MALNINSVTANIDNKTIGSHVCVTVDYTSTLDLTGNHIYFIPSLFELTTTLPNPLPTDDPTEGFTYRYYDPTPATHAMGWLPFPNSFRWQNYRAEITITDAFNYSVEFCFLFTADHDGVVDPNQSISNIQRFLNNNINNPVALDNSTPSVYNEERILRLESVTKNDNNNVLQIATHDEPVQANWYCEGEATNWSFELRRNNQVVNDFSAFEDTTVQFTFTTVNGGLPSRYNFAIFRTDNVQDNTQYWNDLELNYASFAPLLTPVDTLDFSAFMMGSIVTGGGPTFQAGVTLNNDYFTVGGTYRVIAIPVWTNIPGEDVEASCISNAFTATADPPPTYGEITATVDTPDQAGSTYNTCCIVGAGACMRLRLCAEMSKASYNDAVFANNTTGDYDTNIVGQVQYTTTSTIPDDLTTLTGWQNTDTIITDNAGGCIEYFTIPESWAGFTNHVVFRWHFRLNYTANGQTVTYDDFIYKDIRVTTNDNDIGANIGITILDDTGTPIETLCSTYEGDINVQVTENYATDHDLIPLIQVNGGAWQEFTPYDNTNITPLNTPLIESSDSTVPGGFVIDAGNLDLGDEYCVKVVLPCSNPPVTPDCECFDLDLSQTVSAVSSNLVQLRVEYDITNLADPTQFVDIVIYKDGNLIDQSTSLTGLSFVNVPNAPVITGNYSIRVNMTACFYTFDIVLTTSNQLGNTDSVQEESCIPLCNYLFCPPALNGTTIDTLTSDGMDVTGDPEFNFPYTITSPLLISQDFIDDLELWMTNRGYTFDPIVWLTGTCMTINNCSAPLDSALVTPFGQAQVNRNFICSPV